MLENIGEQLRRAREARDLSLEQVAHSTRMRLRYLQALESGDFAALPSTVQARGFLRTYAGFLGLNSDALLAELDSPALPSETRPAGEEAGLPPAPADASQDPAGTAQAIFAVLGQRLLRQRELLGLSLEDVARHTHLRTHYLHSLECGALDELPSPVQGRGMLKNYATFLGLDPEPLLLQFAEGLQGRLAVRQAALTPERERGEALQIPRRPSALRRLLTGDLFIGALLVIFLGGFMIWGAIRVFAIRSEQRPPETAPSVGQFLASTQAVTSTPATATVSAEAPAEEPQAGLAQDSEGQSGDAPAGEAAVDEGEATEQVTLPAGPSGVVQVYVTVRQRAWIRVTVDDEVEFEGRVIPGSAYQFAGNEQVEILTGNAAALQIFFNQQDLGPMGQFGEVVQRVFTPLGIQTPTPTITPTVTPTPRPSPTSEGTPTLRPFVTATP